MIHERHRAVVGFAGSLREAAWHSRRPQTSSPSCRGCSAQYGLRGLIRLVREVQTNNPKPYITRFNAFPCSFPLPRCNPNTSKLICEFLVAGPSDTETYLGHSCSYIADRVRTGCGGYQTLVGTEHDGVPGPNNLRNPESSPPNPNPQSRNPVANNPLGPHPKP